MSLNRSSFPGLLGVPALTTGYTANQVFLPERCKILSIIIRLNTIVGANSLTCTLWEDIACSLLIFGDTALTTQPITPASVAAAGGVSLLLNQLLPRTAAASILNSGMHSMWYRISLGQGTANLVAVEFDCVWGGEGGVVTD